MGTAPRDAGHQAGGASGARDLALLGMIAVCLAAMALLPAVLRGADRPEGERLVRVRAGQSLWAIAQETGEGGSTARKVAAIRKANGLKDSRVAAGELLKVPSADGAGTARAAND